jgi:hypothetical protein
VGFLLNVSHWCVVFLSWIKSSLYSHSLSRDVRKEQGGFSQFSLRGKKFTNASQRPTVFLNCGNIYVYFLTWFYGLILISKQPLFYRKTAYLFNLNKNEASLVAFSSCTLKQKYHLSILSVTLRCKILLLR